MHQKVAGSITSQGTYLDCGFDSPTGGAGTEGRQPTDVSSLPLPSLLLSSPSLLLPLSLELVKHILEYCQKSNHLSKTN